MVKPRLESGYYRIRRTKMFKIEIWVDGACSGNPGPMGAGIIMKHNDRTKEMSIPLGEGTNNRAELLAVIKALEALKHPEISEVKVFTDSQLVVGIFAQNWKARANMDLITQIKELISKCKAVEFHKVNGHSGVDLNEKADKLAREACKL